MADDVRVPAGWYPDPLGLPQLRWWDNHAWTEHVSDARMPMVAQESVPTRVRFAEPEPEPSPGTEDGATAYEEIDESTIQLSRRARRERERLADEPDDTLGASAAAAGFGDPLLLLEAPERDRVSIEEPSPAARLATAGLPGDAPTSAPYELGTRFDDLLGEPSAPRSAFAHASTAATPLVPDAAPGPSPVRGGQRAEPELRLGTAPAWIMTLLPLYMLVVGLLLLLADGRTDQSVVVIVAMFAVTWVAGVVLAILDGRLLRRRGIEHPASWAWALLGALVYLLARLMRTVRETGTGFGPLLAFLVLGGFLLGGALAVPGLVMQLAPAAFSRQAAQSVAADASVVGARLRVDCPAVPPLLVQQTMVCRAQKIGADARRFDVTVSLQRLNGWIDWRVDDWGVFSAS